jgi:hypothetical protein
MRGTWKGENSLNGGQNPVRREDDRPKTMIRRENFCSGCCTHERSTHTITSSFCTTHTERAWHTFSPWSSLVVAVDRERERQLLAVTQLDHFFRNTEIAAFDYRAVITGCCHPCLTRRGLCVCVCVTFTFSATDTFESMATTSGDDMTTVRLD